MSVVFLPVLKLAVAYAVSSGRRWSVLEHMLLVELGARDRSVAELAAAADLPARMVVEALIALLKANWVEVRADGDGVRFAATAIGRRRATDDELPVHPNRDVRWTSLCFDRVTGAWLRSDDLKLVYQDDLPGDAEPVEAGFSTFDANDGSFRELLPLAADETLEPEEPRLKSPSRPYARFDVSFDGISGLPAYAPARLREFLTAQGDADHDGTSSEAPSSEPAASLRDTFTADDLIVGGQAHLELVRRGLREADTTFVLHSCFVHPGVVERLLPDFAAAAQRGVRVELLWGLRRDPEDDGNPLPVKDAEELLKRLTATQRKRVTLSQLSSGSHAKTLVWDVAGGGWRTVVASCNWLSSWYEAIDVSLVSRSRGLARNVLGWLLAAQLPASGGWSPQARRLNSAWNRARDAAGSTPEKGEHAVTLLVDDDHFAAVRTARDAAYGDIVLGCDLFGSAGETSTLVPMERAAELGRRVTLAFARPTKRLRDEGRLPSADELARRGITVTKVDKLHGKFLLWDDRSFVASSFNWLSTVPDARTRGAELGLSIEGADLRRAFRAKLDALADEGLVAPLPEV